ncbi:LysR family transcriptional regulator [Lactiplantibacillus daoliensis]|uniref:LysR family transcriptional regulator n=1 Tax=Lactiplantibacillus daoliensis TaxID=2559916 RepID=A0ABW1UK80_9LACO|nr:LysR family transcriptional regulator [Lactiplantibacillus daoliensis]
MLKQLQTFIAVYETRNFSQAAEQLFISQPTVSTQIKQLEADLETSLFTRNGRQTIQPTVSGNLLYQQAQKLLETWIATKVAIQTTSETAPIPCRIGASHTTSSLILPGLLTQLAPLSQQFKFEITLANSADILTQMTQHHLDFGLVEKPLVTDHLDRLAFGQDELVHAGQLTSPLWLLREPNSGVRHYTNAYLKAQNIQPTQTMIIHSNQLIADLLAQGIGQTIISKHVLALNVPTVNLGPNYQRQFFMLTPTTVKPALVGIQAKISSYLQNWA